MSKRHSPPGMIPPGIGLTPFIFTVDEVFVWVCQVRGIKPEHLTEARWISIRYTAEQTRRKLNALFAAEKVEA